mgnify:FL=1
MPKKREYRLDKACFINSQYADDVASLGIEYLTTDNPNMIEISINDFEKLQKYFN